MFFIPGAFVQRRRDRLLQHGQLLRLVEARPSAVRALVHGLSVDGGRQGRADLRRQRQTDIAVNDTGSMLVLVAMDDPGGRFHGAAGENSQVFGRAKAGGDHGGVHRRSPLRFVYAAIDSFHPRLQRLLEPENGRNVSENVFSEPKLNA